MGHVGRPGTDQGDQAEIRARRVHDWEGVYRVGGRGVLNGQKATIAPWKHGLFGSSISHQLLMGHSAHQSDGISTKRGWRIGNWRFQILRGVIYLWVGTHMKTRHMAILLAIGAVALFLLVEAEWHPAKIRSGPGCSFYLKQIQLAKMIYAEQHGVTNVTVFSREQLLAYGFGGKWPKCPRGGEYSIGALHESPRCSCPEHNHLTVSAN